MPNDTTTTDGQPPQRHSDMTPEARQTSRDLTAGFIDLVAEATDAIKLFVELASKLPPEELEQVAPTLEANARRWRELADEVASR